MSKKLKVETIDEYLARGGAIKKLPAAEVVRQVEPTRKTTHGVPVNIMTLEDADLYYGEARKGSKPKKPKSNLKIDLNALPEALRTKFISKLKEEAGGEEYEKQKDEEE